MVKLFDASFTTGTVLAIVAVVIAVAAATRDDLPLVGSGVGALLAVAVVGMAACAIAGISQAPALGWTSPSIVVGVILGILSLAVIAAGVLGWAPLVDPIGRLLPMGTATVSAARVAALLLAGLIAVKWVVGLAMAFTAR